MPTHDEWVRKWKSALMNPDGLRVQVSILKGRITLGLGAGGDALRSQEAGVGELEESLSALCTALGGAGFASEDDEIDLEAILAAEERKLEKLDQEAAAIKAEKAELAARVKRIRRIVGDPAKPREKRPGAPSGAQRVRDFVASAKGDFSTGDLRALGIAGGVVGPTLNELLNAGQIQRVGHGVYRRTKKAA